MNLLLAHHAEQQVHDVTGCTTASSCHAISCTVVREGIKDKRKDQEGLFISSLTFNY